VASRPQPEQQAPPVQRLRVKYAKRGRARFASHRDFGRAFERALRRAAVPMAYSSGFSPHPRISYANAAPTGAASEAEYLEIGLATAVDPESVRAALDAALPEGLDVIAVAEAPPGALADLLTGSRWRIDVVGIPTDVMKRAVGRFLGESGVEVERMTKAGLRQFDARGAVLSVRVDPEVLDLVLAHTAPLVRPDDVLTALSALDDDWRPAQPPRMTRLRHGTVSADGVEITEPL
jgi:radical SAM-linked protein